MVVRVGAGTTVAPESRSDAVGRGQDDHPPPGTSGKPLLLYRVTHNPPTVGEKILVRRNKVGKLRIRPAIGLSGGHLVPGISVGHSSCKRARVSAYAQQLDQAAIALNSEAGVLNAWHARVIANPRRTQQDLLDINQRLATHNAQFAVHKQRVAAFEAEFLHG
jgi:hypothetical protein